ncbi:MAG TPA: hypothetical protein VGU67_11925 [Edaphobacter sp.]|nr:hypothetical protein [Edaphobacter sp.]
MGNAPSYLMMKLSFWLTVRTLASGVKMALTALDMNPEQLASAASKQGENCEPEPNVLERRSGKSTAAYRVCQV